MHSSCVLECRNEALTALEGGLSTQRLDSPVMETSCLARKATQLKPENVSLSSAGP